MSDLSQRLQDALAGRYRIERELGRGGMATVFLAEDLKHHRRVAIKVLDPEVATAIGPARFLREIETAARLTHPHILPLHDSDVADGLLFYVMPYVDGESLRERLRRDKQLPIEDALRIAREVASALDCAHQHGVVHRDVKPENVLLESGMAVVADFGVARAAAAAGRAALTPAGIAVGTPEYMSPEQAAGSSDVDGRSDVYSLGCVLYEMLAGQPPFTGPTAESLVHQHLNVAPRPVAALRAAVPESVSRALATALAKPAADRFRTAAEFAAAIGPGVARSDRAADRAEAPPSAPRRATHRAGWAAAVAVVLLAVVLGALALSPGTVSRWLGASRVPAPAKKEWILVAEFEGPRDDPSLARATRELVSGAIDQSAAVGTVPRDQIQVALERARKPDTLALTADLAHEIAYQSTVRMVLEGLVARLGSHYTVTVRVSDVEANRQLLALTDVARSEDALIPVVTRLGARVRERLEAWSGMTPTIRTGEWPVATASFDAYRRWAEGLRIYNEGDGAGSLQLFREALAIDPDFGVAWASAGFAYMWGGQQDSALLAMKEALRHPRSLTPAYRLLTEGRVAWWSGDPRGAIETFDRVARLYPGTVEAGFAWNYEGFLLSAAGRLSEALDAYTRAGQLQPLGQPQMSVFNRTNALISLGRLAEATAKARDLRGTFRQQVDLSLSLAGGDWNRADSLAASYEDAQGTSLDVLVASASARAQVLAVRGEVGAAEDRLKRVGSLLAARGRPAQTAKALRSRVLLALMSGRPAPRPEPWLERDTTTSALISRAYMAAAAGETTLAGHLLAGLRMRPTTRLGAHGSTPEFIEACLAARAGRWNDVVRLIARPAREGSDRGSNRASSVDDRIGIPHERWLVAQAYERLDQPDSAVAFHSRMIAPQTPSLGLPGLVHPFVHQRLVMLYTRMGRIEEAARHLAILERDCTRPDPDLRLRIDEARAAVRSARDMSRPQAMRF